MGVCPEVQLFYDEEEMSNKPFIRLKKYSDEELAASNWVRVKTEPAGAFAPKGDEYIKALVDGLDAGKLL